MTRFEPGLYIFHPIDAPEGVNISLGALILPVPPPDVPVRVLKDNQHWLVKASENSTFNVSAGKGHPDTVYKWIERLGALYGTPTKSPTDFTITSAGNNTWVIQIPNKDEVLTYHAGANSDGSVYQLVFEHRKGSSAQQFEAIRIDKH